MLEIIPDMGKTNTLEHNTRHLPRSAYHIGYVDLMLDEVIKRFPKWSKNEEIRSAMLKSIQKSLIEAIDTFAKDKYAYGKIERQ